MCVDEHKAIKVNYFADGIFGKATLEIFRATVRMCVISARFPAHSFINDENRQNSYLHINLKRIVFKICSNFKLPKKFVQILMRNVNNNGKCESEEIITDGVGHN